MPNGAAIAELFVQVSADRRAFDASMAGVQKTALATGKQVERALKVTPPKVTAAQIFKPPDPGQIAQFKRAETAVKGGSAALVAGGKAASGFGTRVATGTRLAASLSSTLGTALSPQLSAATSGLSSATSALGRFGARGIAAGLAIGVAAAALLIFLTSLKNAQKFTLELNKALRRLDLPGLRGQLDTSLDRIEEFNATFSESAGIMGVVEGALGAVQRVFLRFSGTQAAAEVQAQTLRAEINQLFEAFGRAELLLPPQIELLKVQEATAKAEEGRAETIGAVVDAVEKQQAIVAQTTALEIRRATIASKAEKERLENAKLFNLAIAEEQRLQLEVAAIRERGEQRAIELLQTRRKIAFAFFAESSALEAKRAKTLGARAASENKFQLTRLNAERAAAVAIAKANGEVAADLEGFQKRRRRLIEDNFRTQEEFARKAAIAEISAAATRARTLEGEAKRIALQEMGVLQLKEENRQLEFLETRRIELGNLRRMEEAEAREDIRERDRLETEAANKRLAKEKEIAAEREAAAARAVSATGTVLSIAREELGVGDQTLLNQQQVQAGFARAEARARGVVDAFRRGAAVGAGQLQKSLSILGQAGQVKELGTNLGTVIQTGLLALLDPSKFRDKFKELGKAGGIGFLEGVSPSLSPGAIAGGEAGGVSPARAGIAVAAQTALREIEGLAEAGSPELVQNLGRAIMNQFVREINEQSARVS